MRALLAPLLTSLIGLTACGVFKDIGGATDSADSAASEYEDPSAEDDGAGSGDDGWSDDTGSNGQSDPEGALPGDCDDGDDNDGDGLIDCDDPDCDEDRACDGSGPGSGPGDTSADRDDTGGGPGGGPGGPGSDSGFLFTWGEVGLTATYTGKDGSSGTAYALWVDEALIYYGGPTESWEGVEYLGFYEYDTPGWLCYWLYETASTSPVTTCPACDFAFAVEVTDGSASGSGCTEIFNSYGLYLSDLEQTVLLGYQSGVTNYWSTIGYPNTGLFWYYVDGSGWDPLYYNYVTFQ